MKVFSIINTFDKKEWQGYLTYIALYHKPKSIVGQVAQWLDTSALWKKDWNDTLTAEKLLSKSNLTIKSQTFSNALTQLGNIAEEYVGWTVWRNSKPRRLACQLEGLAKKNLSDEYLKTQREVLEDSPEDKISIWDDFYKMRTLFEDYNFQIRPFEDNYIDLFRNILKYYSNAIAKISQILTLEINNRRRLLSEEWDQELSFLKPINQTQTKVLTIMNLLNNIISKDDDTEYRVLAKLLQSEELEQYSKHIQFTILTYCINYLNRKGKQGETYRAIELLRLYELGFNKGILTLNDYLSIRRFINIIGVASKIEEYEWARENVDRLAIKVDRKNYKSISVFGHATIDFYERKYDKVIKALAQLKSSNFDHRLLSRWLYLRAQFELNRDFVDALKVQIDNFRRFIISNNSNINTQTFKGLKASIKILNMLLDRKSEREVKEYYYSRKYIFERKWIDEKIKNPA